MGPYWEGSFVRSDVKYTDCVSFFFFQAEDGIRDLTVTGVQTCALPISRPRTPCARKRARHFPTVCGVSFSRLALSRFEHPAWQQSTIRALRASGRRLSRDRKSVV